MPPKKKEISLLPDSENSNALVNKLLRWVTTVGRAIIIVTELVVVSAFISRFWLDRKNSDLSEVIRQQKAILESTQSFEKEYLLLQTRLKSLDQDQQKVTDLDQKILSLSSSIPLGIVLQSISLDSSKDVPSVNLSAIAYEENSIVDFITNLSLNKDLTNIDIKKIEKKPKDDKYIIDLAFNLKTTSSKQ